MSDLTVRVRRKRAEALDIASFELVRPEGGPLPGFSAGSHVDVHVPGGPMRPYSLCNDDGDPSHYRIAVLRDAGSRGGSTAMHDGVAEGDLLVIGAPRNQFPLQHAARTLLFAGGIGITPLLCMAQRLAASGADFRLHYCTRSAERTAFRDELAASPFAERVRFHHDDGDAGQRFDARAALADPHPDQRIYVCGPRGFIDHVTAAARASGLPADRIHIEHFAAEPVDASGDRAFGVRIASSGLVCDVPAGTSVVQALAAHGVEIPVSCEQGICGTCVTRVLAGECDHRDMYFSEDEQARNDQFTPCCSRAKSPLLVLDL